MDSEADKTRAMAAVGGWVYGSVQDLLLHVGIWFVAAAHLHPDTTYSGPSEQARADRDMVYAEGFYLANGQAHLGAWCATTGGEIHYGPVTDAYLGMAMLETFRRAITRRTGSAGVFIAQPKDNFRLLRAGMPPGAVLDAGYRLAVSSPDLSAVQLFGPDPDLALAVRHGALGVGFCAGRPDTGPSAVRGHRREPQAGPILAALNPHRPTFNAPRTDGSHDDH